MVQTRINDTYPMKLDGDESVHQILKVNRTISIWPVIGSAFFLLAGGVFQATVMFKSNEQLQVIVTQQSVDIRNLTQAINNGVRENDKLSFRVDTTSGRIDLLNSRVEATENRVTLVEREMRSKR